MYARYLVGLSALALAALAAAPAAACTVVPTAHPAAFHDDAVPNAASSLFHQADFGQGNRSIIGMWSFKFVAGGNTIDFGYVQWHSDGTELQNSGGRAPATENFCMGVWRQTGPGRYHLNHLALSYDTSGTLNARVNIKEDVTVDGGGATYSGPFTLDVSNALLQHVAGQVTAQRVAAY